MIEQEPPRIADASRSIVVPDTMVLASPLGAFILFRGSPPLAQSEVRALVGGSEHTLRLLTWHSDGCTFALGWFRDVIPTQGFTLLGPQAARLEVSVAQKLSGEPSALADFLRETGAPPEAAAEFLLGGSGHGEAEARTLAAILADLAEPDGVIEVIGRPATGGAFLQGWSGASVSGDCRLVLPAGIVSATAAGFERADVLAPARGICLHAQAVTDPAALRGGLLILGSGGLRKLSVLEDAARLPDGADTTDHVRGMLARMIGDEPAIAPFQRICRPEYAGEDTLSGYSGPVAGAFDCAFQGPSGDLFLSGWLLDPLHHVDLVLVKSQGGFYARLDTQWQRLQRPDLNEGFAGDPRFAPWLDPRETLYGFLVHVPAEAGQEDARSLYLEIVLADGSCLFRPLDPATCRDRSATDAILTQVPNHHPALSQILRTHVAPFVAGLPCRTQPRAAHVHRLGVPRTFEPAADLTSSLIPLRDPRQLEPLLAALFATPEADRLDVLLAADATLPPDLVESLDDRFRFYGVTGGVVLVPPHMTDGQRLDVLLGQAFTRTVLVWHPSVLPKRPGWLDALCRVEAEAADRALVSPILTYEDGTLHYGGASPGADACRFAGLDRHRIQSLTSATVSSGAAEVALVDRQWLLDAGGFEGGLLGDRFIHVDLARRLRAGGASVWATPCAEFWMLERGAPRQTLHVVDQLDATLVTVAEDFGPLREECPA